MNQNSNDFFTYRADPFYDFFIPVEESIVLEPEVFVPDDSLVKASSSIYNENEYRFRSNSFSVPRESFSAEEAKKIGIILGVDWNRCPFDIEQYRLGLNTELEHGRISPQTNVTGDDAMMTGKLALAHLLHCPDYYTRLSKMMGDAVTNWSESRPGY